MRKIILSGLAALSIVVAALMLLRGGPPGSSGPAPEPPLSEEAAPTSAVDPSAESSGRTLVVESEPGPLLVRVMDSTGGQLSDVAIRVAGQIEGDPIPALASSAGIGEWLLDPRPRPSTELLVSAADCVPKSVLAPDWASDSIEVVLERMARIEGRVLLGDGRPAAAGILVLALREDHTWNAHSLRNAVLGDSETNRGVTDAEGRFSIELASPGARYDLAAGGKGHVCTKVVRGVLAGERNAVLHIERAYAVWLRIREPGGATPRVPSELFGSRYGTAKPVHSGLTALHGLSPQIALVAPGESLEELSSNNRLLVYHSPSAEDQVGPVQIRLDWPGYEAAELTFMVPAVEGPIEERLLELNPMSEPRAPVRVHWTGLPQELPAITSLESLAALRFESELTGAFDLALRTFSTEPSSLGDLPCSTYRVWLTLGSLPVRGVPEGEPTLMQVGPDGFTLTFDLSDKGWVRLDFALPDGQLYAGKASIFFGPGSLSEGLAGESRMFSGAPYLFGPLETGFCFAYLDLPRMGDRTAGAAKAAAVEFEVLPGVVTAASSRLAGSR